MREGPSLPHVAGVARAGPAPARGGRRRRVLRPRRSGSGAGLRLKLALRVGEGSAPEEARGGCGASV